VPAYDRPRLLLDTLNSLLALRVPAGTRVEIIVIGPTSQPETVRVAEAARSGPIPVRFLPELRPGLSHARNQGLREAAFEHVVFFDDDVRVAPEWIEGFREAVEKHEADCVVGPVTPVFERARPAYVDELMLGMITSDYSRRGPEILLLSGEARHEVPGCNFGVRKAVALDVGGFRPEFGRCATTNVAGEDFDFGDRLVLAGKRVVYQPRCAVGHVISAQKLTKRWLRQRWHGDGVARRLKFREHGGRMSAARALRAAAGIVRRGLAALVLRLRGDRSGAFREVLEMVRAWGYLFPPRRSP
jgi:glucosyl-dolichyl phosphate glucuronosyltransferase